MNHDEQRLHMRTSLEGPELDLKAPGLEFEMRALEMGVLES